MASNPFTPTFGVVPAFMAGREDITSELLAALEEGVGNPNLTTIISGARGTGKTALLTYLSDAAQAQGWVSVNVSALPGMPRPGVISRSGSYRLPITRVRQPM